MIQAIQSAAGNVDPVCMCTGISHAIDYHLGSFTKRFPLDYNHPCDGG